MIPTDCTTPLSIPAGPSGTSRSGTSTPISDPGMPAGGTDEV